MTDPADEEARAARIAVAIAEAFGRDAAEVLFTFRRCDAAGKAELLARSAALASGETCVETSKRGLTGLG